MWHCLCAKQPLCTVDNYRSNIPILKKTVETKLRIVFLFIASFHYIFENTWEKLYDKVMRYAVFSYQILQGMLDYAYSRIENLIILGLFKIRFMKCVSDWSNSFRGHSTNDHHRNTQYHSCQKSVNVAAIPARLK